MRLVADSGATKTAWCILNGAAKKVMYTQGISPYYLNSAQISALIEEELLPQIGEAAVDEVFYYGTGCVEMAQINIVQKGIQQALTNAVKVSVQSDLEGAAKALCGHNKGVACILGTGSNSCVYNGIEITKNNPAPGFILGDEGSGAYLGKKVLQYYIYNTFDEDLMHKFNQTYETNYRTILNHVYKQPLPNRYLAGFTTFLSSNRGHYMIENILEDGIGDFFLTHLYKYTETWSLPIHFTGSIAWYFQDIIKQLCSDFELTIGNILQAPIDGLAIYHQT